jgi:hypothetical protein
MAKTGVVVCLLWLAISFGHAQNPDGSSHGSKTLLLALENAWNKARFLQLNQPAHKTLSCLKSDGLILTVCRFVGLQVPGLWPFGFRSTTRLWWTQHQRSVCRDSASS